MNINTLLDNIREAWHKLPASARYEIVSAVNTFITVFASVLLYQLEAHETMGMTFASFIALGGVALRSAFKAVLRLVTNSYKPNL